MKLPEYWIFDVSKTNFRPDDYMNRAEFVKTVIEASWDKIVDPLRAWFKDVSSDAWYTQYLDSAVQRGIVKSPDSSNSYLFNPERYISKENALKVAMLAFWIKIYDHQWLTPLNDVAFSLQKRYIVAAYNLWIISLY